MISQKKNQNKNKNFEKNFGTNPLKIAKRGTNERNRKGAKQLKGKASVYCRPTIARILSVEFWIISKRDHTTSDAISGLFSEATRLCSQPTRHHQKKIHRLQITLLLQHTS